MRGRRRRTRVNEPGPDIADRARAAPTVNSEHEESSKRGAHMPKAGYR